MTPAWPRYLLLADAVDPPRLGPSERSPGRWRFVLQPMGTDGHTTAEDAEPGFRPARLALMAVVRGLEALEQPSRVKLVTSSGYVRRGVTRGLAEWRARGWKWERFGRLTPIRDEDLWRRVDLAMRYHQVSCRGWSTGGVEADAPAPKRRLDPPAAPAGPRLRYSDHVVSEPALLIVRGACRRFRPGSDAERRLAAAG